MYKFKTAPDTNIIISAKKSPYPNSLNKKYLPLWIDDVMSLFYSRDTLKEYIEKLFELEIDRNEIKNWHLSFPPKSS